jgi:hypothetical protein
MSMRRPRSLAGLIALAALAPGAATAAEIAYLAPDGGQVAIEAIGAIADLSGVPQSLDAGMAASDGRRRICVELRHAALATERQAMACALGCWWLRPDGPQEAVVFTRAVVLPEGQVQARWTPSSLIDRPELPDVVRSLLAPWLGPGAGIAYERDSGSWPATLDRPGQARLVQLLALLERPHACCPDAMPDPEQPDLRRDLASPVTAGSWEQLARGLSEAADISVALGPGLALGGACPDALPQGSISSTLRALRASGVHAEVRHGVICLDRASIGNCEHPASSRQLAIIPIAHLARSAAEGSRIAAAVRQVVTPEAWALPGWGLHFIPATKALLAAADPEHLHAVLDALATIDQLGLDDGLRALGASAEPAQGAQP